MKIIKFEVVGNDLCITDCPFKVKLGGTDIIKSVGSFGCGECKHHYFQFMGYVFCKKNNSGKKYGKNNSA